MITHACLSNDTIVLLPPNKIYARLDVYACMWWDGLEQLWEYMEIACVGLEWWYGCGFYWWILVMAATCDDEFMGGYLGDGGESC